MKLNSTLKRVSDGLILSEEDDEQVARLQLSPVVDLVTPEQLHGLGERIVAVESLIFLSKQYLSLQGYLEHLLSANKTVLHTFYAQVSLSKLSLSLMITAN